MSFAFSNSWCLWTESPHEPCRKEYYNINNHKSLVTECCIRLLAFANVKSYSFCNIQYAFSTHTQRHTHISMYAHMLMCVLYMNICVCMCMHAVWWEVNVWYLSLLIYSLIFKAYFLNLYIAISATLAGQWAIPVSASLTMTHWAIDVHHHIWIIQGL